MTDLAPALRPAQAQINRLEASARSAQEPRRAAILRDRAALLKGRIARRVAARQDAAEARAERLAHPAASLPAVDALADRVRDEVRLRAALKAAQREANAPDPEHGANVKLAEADVLRLEALAEIGKATDADLDAARARLRDLRESPRPSASTTASREARKLAVQLEAVVDDVRRARPKAQEAVSDLVRDDVAEVAALVRRALTLNERVQAAADAARARGVTLRGWHTLPEDAARRLDRWAADAESHLAE